MRASMVVPGVSEGVLPPNAEPVTFQEALHHLAKMVSVRAHVFDSLSPGPSPCHGNYFFEPLLNL